MASGGLAILSRNSVPRCSLDLHESANLDLPYALARNRKLARKLVECRRVVGQTACHEHATLPPSEHVDCGMHGVGLLRAFFGVRKKEFGVRRLVLQHVLPLADTFLSIDWRVERQIPAQATVHIDHLARSNRKTSRNLLGELGA
ncbi:hypothetical protein ACVWXL_008304 [Bradyrhizobium sp. GM22.5]